MRIAALGTILVAFLAAAAGPVSPSLSEDAGSGTLEVVSVHPQGEYAATRGQLDISDRGRFVLFETFGGLVRRDLRENQSRVVGILPNRRNGWSRTQGGVLSAHGRVVAFWGNSIIGPKHHRRAVGQVYVRDVRREVTRQVSVTSERQVGNRTSRYPALGGNGRYVAFQSRASNLVPEDANRFVDVFIRDWRAGITELVSVAADGGPANGGSGVPALSGDGRTVVFQSAATNLVAGDTNSRTDIFARDLDTGITTLLSVRTDGTQSTGRTQAPAVSGDANTVAFVARANALDPHAQDSRLEIFVRDVLTGETTRVAPDAPAGESIAHTLSEDGRFVAYGSTRGVTPDCQGSQYVYLYDRQERSTACLSPWAGDTFFGESGNPHITVDGASVLFESDALLIPAFDQDGFSYAYLWRRATGG